MTVSSPKGRPASKLDMTTKRVRDFVLYICIGVAVGFLCIEFAESNIDSKWMALLFETCLVFGFVIAEQRQFRNRTPFWIVLLVLFAIHLVIAVFIVQHISNLKAVWVGTAFVIEAAAFTALLDSAVRRLFSAKTRRQCR